MVFFLVLVNKHICYINKKKKKENLYIRIIYI